MDLRIQLTTLAIIFANLVYAQCNPRRIEVVKNDSCEYVVMSKEKFAYYYKAEKNLKIIKDSLPRIKKDLKDRKETTIILNDNVDEMETMVTDQNKALSFCYSNLTSVELENIKLAKQTKFYKRTTIGGIALFITTLLILK